MVAEMGSNGREDSGRHAVIPLLQAIRGDQLRGQEEHKTQFKRLANSLTEQNTAINRLSTDVAGLSIRTATLELEQRKQATTIGLVKERQDGCSARVTHAEDSTEIRQIRDQLHKAISKRLTPTNGRPAYQEKPQWWTTPAGKAILGALAGLLVALTSAVTTWIAMSPGQPDKAVQEAAQDATRDAVRSAAPVSDFDSTDPPRYTPDDEM